jgi:hypothetical protein
MDLKFLGWCVVCGKWLTDMWMISQRESLEFMEMTIRRSSTKTLIQLTWRRSMADSWKIKLIISGLLNITEVI